MRALNGVSTAPLIIIGRNTRPVWNDGEAVELLEVQAHHERQPVVADDEREPDGDADRDVASPEQLERHHRMRRPPLPDDERGAGDDGDERTQRARSGR